MPYGFRVKKESPASALYDALCEMLHQSGASCEIRECGADFVVCSSDTTDAEHLGVFAPIVVTCQDREIQREFHERGGTGMSPEGRIALRGELLAARTAEEV